MYYNIILLTDTTNFNKQLNFSGQFVIYLSHRPHNPFTIMIEITIKH